MDFIKALGEAEIDFSKEIFPHNIGRINAWHNGGYHHDIGNIESWLAAQLDF
jgi:mannose-1-phosphate guanylyltransferase